MGLEKISSVLRKDMKLLVSSLDKTSTNKTESIFSFATRHPSKTTIQKGFMEDSLLLCHSTDYAPVNGLIKSTRDATGGKSIRNSVHFSVNHSVTPHIGGSWEEKKYCIMIPFDKALCANVKRKFVAGTMADIYTNGSVRLPQGTVIVRHNKRLKPGTYKIRKAEQIKQFKELQGVIVIDSSILPSQISSKVIEKMGYDVLKEEHRIGVAVGNAKSYIANMKKFNTMAKRNNIFPIAHAATPNAVVEVLLGMLTASNKYSNKQDILDLIITAKKVSKKINLPSEINLDKLYNIILESKTPQEALKVLKMEHNIIPTLAKGYKQTLQTLTPYQRQAGVDHTLYMFSNQLKRFNEVKNMFAHPTTKII